MRFSVSISQKCKGNGLIRALLDALLLSGCLFFSGCSYSSIDVPENDLVMDNGNYHRADEITDIDKDSNYPQEAFLYDLADQRGQIEINEAGDYVIKAVGKPEKTI